MASNNSQALLNEARKNTMGYDSGFVRATINERMFSCSRERIRPRDWQNDVSEAVLLELDCAVIAGTGS